MEKEDKLTFSKCIAIPSLSIARKISSSQSSRRPNSTKQAANGEEENTLPSISRFEAKLDLPSFPLKRSENKEEDMDYFTQKVQEKSEGSKPPLWLTDSNKPPVRPFKELIPLEKLPEEDNVNDIRQLLERRRTERRSHSSQSSRSSRSASAMSYYEVRSKVLEDLTPEKKMLKKENSMILNLSSRIDNQDSSIKNGQQTDENLSEKMNEENDENISDSKSVPREKYLDDVNDILTKFKETHIERLKGDDTSLGRENRNDEDVNVESEISKFEPNNVENANLSPFKIAQSLISSNSSPLTSKIPTPTTSTINTTSAAEASGIVTTRKKTAADTNIPKPIKTVQHNAELPMCGQSDSTPPKEKDPVAPPPNDTKQGTKKDLVQKRIPINSQWIQNPNPVLGQKITIYFQSTWGDAYYVGLSGIQVLDENLKPYNLNFSQLSANPKDMNSISGHTGDYRTLDKLIDDVFVTTDDTHMWLIPLTLTENPYLEIDMKKKVKIGGVRIYNYNKSLEDSFRGCKKIRVDIDGETVSPQEGYLIRKSPGHSSFDYGNTVLISPGISDLSEISVNPSSVFQLDIQEAIQRIMANKLQPPRQEYQTSLLPCAFIFKISLLSNVGNIESIGLDTFEMFDANHKKILLSAQNFSLVHSDSKELQNIENTSSFDQLLNRNEGSSHVQDGWLIPFSPGTPRYLYVYFEEPVAISLIKIWNYSKNPLQGVEDFEIHADDILIYKGSLKPVQSSSSDTPTATTAPSHHQSILFTNDSEIVQKEKLYMCSTHRKGQQVTFVNDGKEYHLNSNNNNNNNNNPIQGNNIKEITML